MRFLQLLLPAVLLILCVPAAAHVEPARLIELKERMCHARSNADAVLPAQEVRRLVYSCVSDPEDYQGGWLWLRADQDDVRHLPEGWRLLIDQTRFKAMRTIFVYADGRIVEHYFRSGHAEGHWAVGGFLRTDVPARAVPVTEVYLGVERLVNLATMRKVRVVSEAEFARTQTLWVALASAFAGVVVASLAYTSFLYTGLRHAFLRQYAFWCLAVLAYGLSWSNLIFYVAPALAGSWGVRLNLFTAGAATLFAALFLKSFLEPRALPRGLQRLLVATGWASLIAAVLAAFDQLGAGYAYVADRVLNAIVAFGVVLVIACITVAARRGSRSVRFYALAWSPTLAAFVLRMLRNFHLIPHADWIDMSLFGATVIETMLLSLAISDRFRKLEAERNSARAERAEFSRLAEIDVLTGIYNRRGFVARAEELIAKAKPVGLILIDADHFKSINDRFGHDSGDQVLAAIGRALAPLSGPGRVVGRLGGEEFGVVALPAGESLASLAERLRRELGQLSFTFGGKDVRISVSVGVADPGRPASFIELYRSADLALYDAKAGGRDRVVMAGAPTPKAA
jgi:diguanylate cyclase (GGDEF)-like protein